MSLTAQRGGFIFLPPDLAAPWDKLAIRYPRIVAPKSRVTSGEKTTPQICPP